MKIEIIIVRILALAALLLNSTAVFSGGPLVVDTNGRAVVWSSAVPVSYHTDLGGLGFLSQSEAVALTKALFDPWETVPTATIQFNHAGSIEVDVDDTNFGRFLGPFGNFFTPLGQNVIVFDEDGRIFDTLFGVGTSVLGFGSPAFFSDGINTVSFGNPIPPNAKIIEGLAFLNGKFIDRINDPLIGNFELSLATFEAVFIHEFGHFSGLHHTQIHGLNNPPESDLPGMTQPIETMFPFIVDSEQRSLEQDDRVALSVLYPTPEFLASTGRIIGRIFNNDGKPISGINIVARNVDNLSDAVSFVSGTNLFPKGKFFLNGLTPGASYQIEAQEIDIFHQGGSRLPPFDPPIPMPGPPEFYNGRAESADPAIDDPNEVELIVAKAGKIKRNVDITLNSQFFQVNNIQISGTRSPLEFTIGDFDDDGKIDFLGPQLGFDPGNVIQFYRGSGNGSFSAPVIVARFPGNQFVVSGNFNPRIDDFLDIAVASTTLNEVRVYFGDGMGTFNEHNTLLVAPNGFPFSLQDLAIGDLNEDSVPDLVTLVVNLNNFSATVYSLLSNASGRFTVVETALASGSGYPNTELEIIQITGNAANDVIGIGFGSSLGLLIGDGMGGFTPKPIPLSSISNFLEGSSLATGDFNEDGDIDIVVSDAAPVGGPPNFTRSFMDILVGDGSAGFTLSHRYEVPESFQSSIVVADLDGDTHQDIASTGALPSRGSPGAKVNVAFGDGLGGVAHSTTIWGLHEFPGVMAGADLNGDQRIDLLVSNKSSGVSGLDFPTTYSVLLQESVATGDLNNDGCIDLTDLNILQRSIRGRKKPHNPSFDLNGDDAVDIADARKLVTLFTNVRGAPCN